MRSRERTDSSKMDSEDLSGKLILVTGGGSGIGRSACRLLAECGAKLAIADINFEAAQETQAALKNPDDHLSIHMDVSLSKSVQEGAAKIEQHFGGVPSGLLHCAAIVIVEETRLTSLQCSESDWDRVIQINLKGTFLVNTTFATLMRDRSIADGSIVNVTSLARHGYPPFIDYSASKAGVVGITKTLASELGQYKIRVNAVSPAMVLTPMLKTAPEIILKRSIESNPLRRLAEPDEIARVCLFLLNTRSSSYVNGQVIGVDGGEVKLICRYD